MTVNSPHDELCNLKAEYLSDRLKLGQTLFLTKGRITPQEFEQRVINLLNRMIRG
ncbi:hypothetical protein H6G64_36945 [Calothrix sp. FACHB-156]|nr:hypothetical protein [Nostoc linckia FACHB-104]MBD2342486.1 hypothetical protein [Calothrix sp. FACHB-156]